MHCFSMVRKIGVNVSTMVSKCKRTKEEYMTYEDIQEGVSWKAAIHVIMSFGYLKRASENSLSEAVG